MTSTQVACMTIFNTKWRFYQCLSNTITQPFLLADEDVFSHYVNSI